MNIQTLAKELGIIFTQQISLSTQLRQILQDENNALEDRHYENAKHLNKQKEQCTAALEKESIKQSDLLKTAGLPYQAESFDKLLKILPDNNESQLRQLKQQLEALLEKCQDQNMVNGQIIAINQQAAETALAILRGQMSNDNIGYTAGGKTVTQTICTSITKA